MKFPQSFIERVRDTSNLVSIIGQHVELKRSGTNSLVGLCPFPNHNEKSPSFSVSEDKQLYYCFGCSKGGNVFTFLEEYRGFSFPESVEYLANQAGLPIETVEEENGKSKFQNSNNNYSSQRDQKHSLQKINALASEYFYNSWSNFPDDHKYKKYAISRGLTPELVQKFRIGICSDSWDGLCSHLEKNCKTDNLKNGLFEKAAKLGLIKKRNNGKGYFDMFRDRLMFPILSTSNDVLGFGGRVLGDDNPKYLNSPESPLFHKGKTFYGLHETAKFIRSEDQAIVVEGYMDLIALYAAGIYNVVAVLGTALTVEHARLLKRYSKNVVVLMDGDTAGARAGLRSLPILLSQGLYPKRVALPDKNDPDDYIKNHGVGSLKKLIKTSDEFYLSLLDEWVQDGISSINKVQLIDKVAPILNQITDKRLKSLYIKETSDRFGESEKWINNALKQTQENSPQPINPQNPVNFERQNHKQNTVDNDSKILENKKKWKLESLQKAELKLLQLGLKSAVNWQKIQGTKAFEKISSPAKPIFTWIDQNYRQVPENFAKLPSLLASKVDRPSFVTKSVFFSQPQTPNDGSNNNDDQYINDCLNWIYRRYLKEKSKSLTKELGKEMTREQMEQFMNVQNMKRSLGKESDKG